MPDESSSQSTPERAPVVGVPMQPEDLTPAYANAAQVQFSDYEFTVTFLRAEYLLQGQGPEGQTPVAIAGRVALSHRAMREFLDAAVDNYAKFREMNPEAPPLKLQKDAADS